ncbi:MAG: translocation/assembly module TamB [Gemmatimonadota bacterium]
MAVRVARWIGVGLVLLTVVVLALAYLLIRSQPGHDFALRLGLRQLSGLVNGQVAVAGIHSSGLLQGFTLRGLAIRDAEGRPFLEADSVRVRYSYRELLARRIVLVPVGLWGADITIETLSHGARSNVERIFLRSDSATVGDEALSEPSEDGGLRGFSIALRDVEIHDAGFVLRRPIQDGEGIPDGIVEASPQGGGPLQVIRFDDIFARLVEGNILDPDRSGEVFEIEELSFTGYVFQNPIRIEEFEGTVARAGDGLSLDVAVLRFPGSAVQGTVAVDWSGSSADGGVSFDAELGATELTLSDFHWLEPRLPDGEGSGDLTFTGTFGSGSLRVTDAVIRSGRSRIEGAFGLDLGDPIRVADTQLEFDPFELAAVDVWLEEPLAITGLATGNVSVRGPFGALVLNGRVEYVDPALDVPPLSATFTGTLHAGDRLGVTGFSVVSDTFRYESLSAFAPELDFTGDGTLQLVATGRLDEGIAIEAELEHSVSGATRSQVSLAGTVARTNGEIEVGLDVILAPLSMEGMAAGLQRDLPVSGDVRGELRADGPLGDLSLGGRLTTVAGAISGTARFDARDPLLRYSAEGSVSGFRVPVLVSGVPDRTEVTGSFSIEGSGGTLETVSGQAEVMLEESRVAGVALDWLDARLRAEGGRLHVDSLHLSSPILVLSGTGDFPLREDEPEGEIVMTFEVESLEALHPLIFGEDPIAVDTLTALERQVLLIEGVDLDTLGVSGENVLNGRMSGEGRARGRLGDVTAEASLHIEEAAYGVSTIARAEATLTGHWMGEEGIEFEASAGFDSLAVGSFAFQTGLAEVQYGQGEGSYILEVEGVSGEQYESAGTFATDSLGFEVVADRLVLEIEDLSWTLAHPAMVRVEGLAFQIDSFQIGRPAEGTGEPVTIAVDGLLDLEGVSDLRARFEGVELARVGTIAQMETFPSGLTGMEILIVGPASSPTIQGDFQIRDFSLNGTTLTLVEGTLHYEDRGLRAEVVGELDGRELLTANGTFPVDLAFQELETRIPDEEIDATLTLTDFPAATALAFLSVLEEVQGTIEGQIELGGTTRDFSPSGEIRLRGGSVFLAELGIRPSEIDADFHLREDGSVGIEATVRSDGIATISGGLSLSDLTDPGFDAISVRASGFQAANRRDLAARVGADLLLTGSYRGARVDGILAIEEGEISLEEFARSAQVIDLSDPNFFDVVDTTMIAVRPTEEGGQNAFLQNLRVEVDVDLERDFWLRSQEINVEIAGDLSAVFDRRTRELLLVGTLEPVRGTYDAYGRQFQVQGGSIGFVGTPGINPTLSINAVARLRREGGEPLNVLAQVRGTLVDPRVSLSSDSQPPIAESDLISYLLFGRPSYALSTGESLNLRAAVASQASQIFASSIASGIGSLVGRGFGLDYVNVTQADDPVGIGSAAGLTGTFAHTQIELGQYLGPNLFLAVLLRPLGGLQAGSQAQIPGARMEWKFTDTWSMEGFVEDRFAREGSSGFGELGLRLSKVLGLSIFREWGY